MFTVLLISFLLISVAESSQNKYYIQINPPNFIDDPSIFYFYTLDQEIYTLNSTEKENMEIIGKKKINENPKESISSIIYENGLTIKTCFEPKKIVEIINEKNEIFTPANDYFNNIEDNLNNVKYCFSTTAMNPSNPSEKIIVTYWTEEISEKYIHKYIIFYPDKSTFSRVYLLNTQNNFYAQSCTNMRNIYIYCNIESSNPLAKNYHFYIDSNHLTMNSIKINLVPVLAKYNNDEYSKPIGLVKSIYTNGGKLAEYFLIENHNKLENKTRLMTSLFIKSYNMTFVMRFENLGEYRGINIEDTYISPYLFNHLLPNVDEIIIIYIMKSHSGKNLLLVNTYDYEEPLKTHSNLEKTSLSNYLREDICTNPKYMKSIFINSYIDYDDKDKMLMELIPNNYYKFQRDIAIIISCDNGNDEIVYDTKKITMPQCLNVLEEINGKTDLLKFKSDKLRITLDINGEPNLKSFRNVEIEFFDSLVYNHFLIVQIEKNSETITISGATKISNIDYIYITRTNNFKKGKTYKLPYRIIQTGFSGVSSTCHLPSGLCYLEFTYQDDEGVDEFENCIVNYCKECENNRCIECEDIIGIKLNSKDNECTCNVTRGFQKDPIIAITDTTKKICVCKDNYSFYKNINTCFPDIVLRSGNFCITGKDDLSLINIYDDIKSETNVFMKNGLPYCEIGKSKDNIWFNMGEYTFYMAKIEKCVYITFNGSIVMYSDSSECGFKNYDYSEYLGININNENEYKSLLEKAYEYKPDDNKNSLIIKTNNITFYLLNNYTKNKFSSVTLSQKCTDIIKKENGLSSLIIFVANIKKEGIISTQVEYAFYNSTPEYMNQKLDLSSCYSNNQRRLQSEENGQGVNIDININTNSKVDDYSININIDEIILNVQINFTEKQEKNIDELYNNKGINLFNSSDDFYNDDCNKYTTQEGTDMYLQDRREQKYIYDALCETGCVQIDYDNITNRVACLCKIKYSEEYYQNVTFSPNELDKKFKQKISFQNWRVVWKCFIKSLKGNSEGKEGSIYSLIMFIIYTLLVLVKFNIFGLYNKVKKIENKIKGEKEKKNKKNNNTINNNKYEIEIFNKPWENPFKGLNQNVDDLKPDDKDQLDNECEINNNNNDPEQDDEDPDVDRRLVENNSDDKNNNINNNKDILYKSLKEFRAPRDTRSIKNNKGLYPINNSKNNYDDNNINNNMYKKMISNNYHYMEGSKDEFSNDKTNNKDSNDETETNNDINEIQINLSWYEKFFYFDYKNYKNDNNIFDDYKKNTYRGYLYIFLSKIIASNIFLFVFYPDENGYLIKFMFLILFIAFYISFNVLTEFKLSTLHLYIHKDDEDSSDGWDYIFNIIFPFLVLYVTRECLKKAFSLREFYIDEKYKIKGLETIIKKHKSKATNKIHDVQTDIKLYRNVKYNDYKRVTILGFILLFFNWYFVTTFCGIYQNSFGCIIVNTLLSIIWTFIISIICHFFSTLFYILELKNLSRLFSIKTIINLFYPCCCCHCLCYDFDKKDYDNEEEEEDNENDNNNYHNHHNIIKNQTEANNIDNHMD